MRLYYRILNNFDGVKGNQPFLTAADLDTVVQFNDRSEPLDFDSIESAEACLLAYWPLAVQDNGIAGIDQFIDSKELEDGFAHTQSICYTGDGTLVTVVSIDTIELVEEVEEA